MPKLRKISLFLLLFLCLGLRISAQPQQSVVILRCNEGDTASFQYLTDLMDAVTFISNYSPLTVQLSPSWADSVVLNQSRLNTIASWRGYGHEIAGLHTDPGSPAWDGYTNDSAYFSNVSFVDTMEVYFNRLRLICADSGFATLSSGPQEPPATDWTADAVFRLKTLNTTLGAFGAVTQGSVGSFPVCEWSAFHCPGTDSLTALYDKFSSTTQPVCGVIFDLDEVAANGTALFDWLNFVGIQIPFSGRNSVRNLMRESGTCSLNVSQNPEPNAHPMQVFRDGFSMRIQMQDRAFSAPGGIFDASGRLISQVNPQNGIFQFDLESLPAGFYFFQTSDAKGGLFHRFVLSR